MEVHKMKKRILWIITFLPTIVTCFVLPYMPSSIPMHYNSAGEIDRWGSKYENFIFPALIILFSLFFNALMRHYQKHRLHSTDSKEIQNAIRNEKVCYYTTLIITLIFNITHYQMMYSAFIEAHSETSVAFLDFNISLSFLMGVAIILIGAIVPKTRMNSTIGVRTKWSIKNEYLWNKSNRTGGLILVIIGILILISSCIFSSSIILIIDIGLLIIATLGCTLYSYYAFKKYLSTQDTKNHNH